MKRISAITIILLFSIIFIGTYIGCNSGGDPAIPDPASTLRFISADLCTACHAGEGAEWEMTAHYRALDDLLQTTWSATCLECHTTGYDGNTLNSGYDDPDEIVAMRFDGVQCESCHGAGNTHVGDREPVIAGLDAELCGTCHNSPHNQLYTEWQSSAHARSIDRRDTNADFVTECLRCHSADYIFAENIPDNATPDEFDLSLTCVVCHDPHSDEHEFQLRSDRAAICNTCHYSGAVPGQEISYPQVDLFLGTGGYKYPDESYSNTAHTTIGEACIACHMWTSPPMREDTPVMGHTFEPTVEACRECHPTLETFDRGGAQTGIQELLDELKAELDAATANDLFTLSYINAKFNYDFIVADGSLGMHNTRYARALLQDSIGDFEPGS